MSMYPIKTVKGTYVNAWDDEYSKIDYFRNILSAMSYQTTIESAYCAKTEEEALAILEKYRKNLNNGGYLKGYLEWLTEKIETVEDVIY